MIKEWLVLPSTSNAWVSSAWAISSGRASAFRPLSVYFPQVGHRQLRPSRCEAFHFLLLVVVLVFEAGNSLRTRPLGMVLHIDAESVWARSTCTKWRWANNLRLRTHVIIVLMQCNGKKKSSARGVLCHRCELAADHYTWLIFFLSQSNLVYLKYVLSWSQSYFSCCSKPVNKPGSKYAFRSLLPLTQISGYKVPMK